MNAGAVIVGAGECGARAAFALREEGFSGPVTLIGVERHLPYERPPLSKDGMMADAPGIRTIADAARFEAAGIQLMLAASVASIDRGQKTVLLGDGETLPYETLLLATGARPRRLALAEASRHCLYLRTHDDAQAIAARLRPDARIAIIGGGFIGLELAAAARKRGCSVTVVETLPRLLARAVPEAIADVIDAAHRENGVDIRCGSSIAAIDDIGDGVAVRLTNGASITADLCIVGIGAVPNAELAEQAGLAVENGIRVDGTLRTDDPVIFAAGDLLFVFRSRFYGGRRVRLEAWRKRPGTGDPWRQGTCLAGTRRMSPCRGSGRINTTSRCRSPGSPTKVPGPCDADTGGGAFLLFSSRGGRPSGRRQRHRSRQCGRPATSGLPRCWSRAPRRAIGRTARRPGNKN
jgi:3-phenylpropionate/trans-cinnamate dioxygenase ferredoxin reductase subunit